MLAVAVFVAALCVDMPVYRWVRSNLQNVDRTDLDQFLRSAGFVPAWILVSLAIIAVDRQRSRSTWNRVIARGGAILASVCVAGVLTEVVKLLARRERPKIAESLYSFRPIWDRPFYSGGLSMPSSHSAIAFAAAFVLARLFPEARIAWYVLAVGTALTRVAEGAHYVSDVCASVLVGAAAARVAMGLATAVSRTTPRSIESTLLHGEHA